MSTVPQTPAPDTASALQPRPAATRQGQHGRTGPFTTHEAMPVDQAMETLFGVIQAMAAIVDLGRFDEAHGDPQQNFCCLIRLFLAPLTDVYSSLSDASTAPDQEGGDV